METMDLTQQMSSLSCSQPDMSPTLSCSQSVPDNLSLLAKTDNKDIEKLSTALSDCAMEDEDMVEEEAADQEVPGADKKYCQTKARTDPVYQQQQQQLEMQLQLQRQQYLQQQQMLQQQAQVQNPLQVYPSLLSHQQYFCPTPQQL